MDGDHASPASRGSGSHKWSALFEFVVLVPGFAAWLRVGVFAELADVAYALHLV